MIVNLAAFSLAYVILLLSAMVMLTIRLKKTFMFIGYKAELLFWLTVFIAFYLEEWGVWCEKIALPITILTLIRSFTIFVRLMGNPYRSRIMWGVKKRKGLGKDKAPR